MSDEDGNADALDLDQAQTQVEERRLLESLDRDGELTQLRTLLAQEGARDFLWRVLSKCHLYQSTYQRNFGDMALSEGMRQVGLWLLNEILEADPEAEILMKRKANRLAHEAARKAAEQRSRRRRPS